MQSMLSIQFGQTDSEEMLKVSDTDKSANKINNINMSWVYFWVV